MTTCSSPPRGTVTPLHSADRPGLAEMQRLCTDLGPDDRAYLLERVQHEARYINNVLLEMRRAGSFHPDASDSMIVKSRLAIIHLSNLESGDDTDVK